MTVNALSNFSKYWSVSQPTMLFDLGNIEVLREKFRRENLEHIFHTLALVQNHPLLKAAVLFLDTRGSYNLNKPALENLVNTTSEYAALAEYLTALCFKVLGLLYRKHYRFY